MRLLVWQLVILALVIGVCGYSSKPWWRTRGTHFGSFKWWRKSRSKGWWW